MMPSVDKDHKGAKEIIAVAVYVPNSHLDVYQTDKTLVVMVASQWSFLSCQGF